MVLVSAIHPPVTLDLHSILAIRPVPIVADEHSQKDVLALFLSFNTVSRQVTGTHFSPVWFHPEKLHPDVRHFLPSIGMRNA
jgi:hypothetical protein